MKSIFKKGLVVLLASLFATCVFAGTTATSTVTPVTGEAAHAVVKHHGHCHMVKGKCVHHKAMKKAHKAAKKAEAAKKAAE